MNNNDNELVRWAREKIKRDQRFIHNCNVIIGPTGATGDVGPTPTITIGSVTTGDPGTDATATITGTAPDFVLNLTIPQGPTGPAA